MTTQEFIEKAKRVHGNKYDYSKVVYTGTFNKVCIICPKHGEFWQTPNGHLNGNGCRQCSYELRGELKKDTNQTFIKKAQNKHGNRYDYSKVEYKGTKTKVCIVCPEHGEFWQTPSDHLSGGACPKCVHPNANMSTSDFVEKAKDLHNDKYDYSKVEYKGTKTKVCIVCPEHGEFWQTPSDHLRGQGCPKCKAKRIWDTRGRVTTDDFISKVIKIHGNKYDYSKVKYINNSTKVCIVCPEHGEFWQTPAAHLNGGGCLKCSKVYRPTTEEWVGEAVKKHGFKYDYSKVEYKNAKTKVCIICHEHGEFWQLPYAHLHGQGCPSCDMSHLENDIYSILNENCVEFTNEDNLNGKLGRMRVDFYLPKYNIVIECQGGQHFYPAFDKRNKNNAENIHKKVLIRDIKKRKILNDNNIKVFYYISKEDYNEKYITEAKFKGLYTKDNLFYNSTDMLHSIIDNIEVN